MSGEAQREMTLHEIMTGVGEQHSAYKEYNQLVWELDKAKHDRDKGYERADREAALAVRLRNAMDRLAEAAQALHGNIGNVGAHDCPGFDCAKCMNPAVGWGELMAAVEESKKL
jgi:hypothetical protein